MDIRFAVVRAALGVALLVLVAGGCKSMVDVAPEAEQVGVSTPEAVAGCERIGRTKTRAPSKLWIFPRRAANVRTDLELLARDDAAEMGGTDVAPLDEAVDGRQEFGIYRCPGGDAE